MKRYIKSDSGFGKDFDVFMLMDYSADIGPDTMGPAGDGFDCYGKFFSKDFATAKKELEALKAKYPWLSDESRSSKYYVNSLYVDKYNPYYDSADSDDPMDVDNNVFVNLEALAKYLGMDNEYNWKTGYPDDGLPFEL